MTLDALMQPGRIGRLELRNRVVFPPIQNRGADENGHATPRMADYFAERGRGGVGLVIVQHSFCWPAAKLAHGLALWDDECIPGLRHLTRAVHATGAKIAIQLGGRGTRQDNGRGSVAPSAIRLSYEKDLPRELSAEELRYFLECYGQAARRAAEAGFDAVEIHGAHGKLISQFLSPYTNRRTDEYGGSVEKRTRFPREIIDAVRRQVGDDFPIIFRLSLTEFFEGGLTREEGLEQVRLLDAAGVDAFHVSGGSQEKVWNTDQSYFFPRMSLVPLAAAAKGATAKPVIAVSRIQDPFMAEQVLEKGQADFVALGRPFLADPDILKKALEGRSADIRRCVYCLNCTTWGSRSELEQRGIGCTVNPAVMREADFALTPTTRPRRILVAGGGLAGMEAARTLALRGHQVDLYETSPHLGGQWRVAARADCKDDFKTLIPWLKRGMEQAGVRVHMASHVNMDLIRELRPDIVVVATGAKPRELPVDRPATGGPAVVQAMDVIMDRAPEVGKRVVVVGGRYIGMEAADKLAREGRHVSLVEALDPGHGTIARLRGVYRDKLVESGVFIFDNSPVLRLSSTGVDVAHCGSMLSLPCETVALAIGTVPVRDMVPALAEAGVEHYVIGDSRAIGDALVAMRDGAELGRAL